MSTKQLQIVTPIVTSVNGKSGDVTVSGGFLCTITGSGTTAKPYVCDKTYSEILQAVKDGFIPYCLKSGSAYGDQDMMYTYADRIHTRDSDYIIFQEFARFSADSTLVNELYILESGEIRYTYAQETRVASINQKTGYVTLKTSDLENDSGYLTEHQSLENYALKTDIPTVTIKTYTSSDIT